MNDHHTVWRICTLDKGLRCLPHESEEEAKGGGGVNDHHTILLENMHVGTANTR